MKKTLRMLFTRPCVVPRSCHAGAAETTDGFASDHICMADMAGVLNERKSQNWKR